jgi:tetratricopeptide (TPR) repeat protein
MKVIAALLFRAGLVAICVFISWRSIRLAVADSIGAPGTSVSLARAIAIEPENADLVARAALVRSDSGDGSRNVDRDLERALRLNPRNSEVLIALGLRREFEGNLAEAGRYLQRAAEVDHTFRASWVRADFSARNNRPDEFWRMARRCLSLEPLGYDPEPVFDLAWRVARDSNNVNSKKILDLLPRTGPRAVQYLRYLIATNRLDAAIEAWPPALNSLDASSPLDAPALTEFTDLLVRNDRLSAAVRAWNQLVDRGMIQSGHLNPDSGVSVADPAFGYPLVQGPFGWNVTQQPGAFASAVPSMLRFEFDGNEPEAVQLLSTMAPVVGGRAYRLVWKYDSSRLASPKDAGFAFVLAKKNGDLLARCQPMLALPDTGSCQFTVPAARDYTAIRIELHYGRALGTVRIKGELRVTEIRLEFAS